jgi:uncharacterized SAM-binding protein YcdF (DUF218 family)
MTQTSSNATRDREHWARVNRVSRWGNTRLVRRWVVLLWIALLAVDPWIVLRLAQRFAVLAKLPALLVPTLLQPLIAWLAFRAMQTGLAQPTLEDDALMQHGEPFDALTSEQRQQLLQQRSKDLLLGRIHRDEREAELRLAAEGTAYRLLRPGLVLVVAAYWAVCLLGPFAAVRETLAITGLAVTWIAIAVLVLPTMVRMWTQPNEVGDPQIVSAEKETAQ